MKKFINYIILITIIAAFNALEGAASIAAPEAGSVSITGSATICRGDSAELTIVFSGESLVPPYSVEVHGPNQIYQFTGISEDTVRFYVFSIGNYTIENASDSEGNLTWSTSGPSISFYEEIGANTNGSVAICPNDETSIPVAFSGVSSYLPFSITYTRNFIDTATISNISGFSYNIPVSQTGDYRLIEVSDANGCAVQLTSQNTYTVSALSEPSALLVGDATICKNGTVPVAVLLEGEGPWEITYSLDGVTEGSIDNITNTPFSFNVNKAGVYGIQDVWDQNCKGEGTGSATIDYYPDVDVNIVGLSTIVNVDSEPIDLAAIPNGGTFSGPGVISTNSKFYPEIAGVEGSPHEIVYAYTDPENSCVYYDTSLVSVSDSIARIFIQNEKPVYCFNDEPITVVGTNNIGETGVFNITGSEGLTDNLDNTATVYPSVLTEGEFTIFYSYFDGEGIQQVTKTIEVEYIDQLTIFSLDEETFCKNDEPIVLQGSNSNGLFSGEGVTGNRTDNFYFDPELAQDGLNSIRYYVSSVNGCVRETYDTVTVNNIPQIDFTVGDSCVSESEPVPITFINQTLSEDPVQQWNWDFNDIASEEDNFSTLRNPTHVYRAAGPRNVKLAAVTVKGCRNEEVINITFGDKPLANFTFSTECFTVDSAIEFSDDTESRSAIEKYVWKFYDKGSTTISNEENPEYVFSARSDYNVEMVAITEFGCKDTMKKQLVLRPTIEPPYLQDFEVENHSWASEKALLSPVNSWKFGQLSGEIFDDPQSQNTAWYTDIEVRAQEDSWVTSPCFSFEGVEKPLIKLNLWRAFEQTRDGAILQATTNNGLNWDNIGTIGDGINWYNSFSIQGTPGNENIGWTDRIDNQWVEARHRLDSLEGKSNVQFRLAYGSDGTGINNEGVAFDNIWIATRNKKVLVEHFTNVGDSLYNATNEVIRDLHQLNPQDMVAIQYHLPAPGVDSFHLANPGGPNIRLIKYGLSGGPMSIVNGNNVYEYEDENDQPQNNGIIASSLQDALFDIDLTTSVQNGIMHVETQTKALNDIVNSEYTLQVAVVYDVAYHYVDGKRKTYYNVFREFVPDAAGITYLGGWAKNDVRIEDLQYEIPADANPQNLSVVAFIQDESTSEVLQAATDQDSLVTSVFYPKYSKLDFAMYPNPATNRVTIKLSSAISEKISIQVLDFTGKQVMQVPVENPVSGFNISIGELKRGVYMVRLVGENTWGIKKLIVQ